MTNSAAFVGATLLHHSLRRHTLPSLQPNRPSLLPRRPIIRRVAAPELSAATPSRAQRPILPRQPSSIPLAFGPIKATIPARLLLCLVPFLTATFLACAKLLYVLPVALSPSHFNAARLLVSSLFFVPVLIRDIPSMRSSPRPLLRLFRAGAELGLLMFVANLLQLLGLRYTDASRAAFLQQMSTVLVPLAAAALRIEKLTPQVTMGAACALAGVGLLTLTAAPAAAAAATLRPLGDLLEVLSAVILTVYMLRTSYHARNTKKSSALVAIKVCSQAALSFIWLGAQTAFQSGSTVSAAAATSVAAAAPVLWTPTAVFLNLMIVLWAGVLVSAAASWLQTKGQQAVPASEAAVLFAAQPLWASVVATLMLGERLTSLGMAGAAMIVSGAVISSTGKKES
ncbi:putative transporter [Gracilariopsis chorda]|uniref:Putative transporter n=1 Tax=Gracilariopsis chorda TaxID=448386 RepID=A0A2V3J448_9FLOR|nr:putative transporter [Gracilariopsis chorda]|eukprot:PXF49083.1 putative transporter [Gracilariopsis chorda]